MNTHLDHVGREARREGVNLVLKRVNELAADAPVIVTGDFNATPDSDVISQVTDTENPFHLIDARSVAGLVYGPAWTFHDFGNIPYERRPLIDYIFVRNGLEVVKYGVLAEMENGEFLSDHAPVFAVVK